MMWLLISMVDIEFLHLLFGCLLENDVIFYTSFLWLILIIPLAKAIDDKELNKKHKADGNL